MVEEDVIEGLVQIKVFGIALHEMQIWMLALCELHHAGADFNAHTERRPDRGKEMARLATDVENMFAGLDDELQNPLETVVEVAVGLNVFVAIIRDALLMFASRLANIGERIRPPCLTVTSLCLRNNHRGSSLRIQS